MLCKDNLLHCPSQLAMSNGPRRNQWGTALPALSQPWAGHFHKFSYHTLLPSPWIPGTARQAHTSLLQSPGLCHSHRTQGTSLRQLWPAQAQGSSWGLKLQDSCVQPSMVSGKMLKNTQIFHRSYSTLPGNMSAASGTELASDSSKLIIHSCFLELISSNAKWLSIAKMKKHSKNNYQSAVSDANKKSPMVSKG